MFRTRQHTRFRSQQSWQIAGMLRLPLQGSPLSHFFGNRAQNICTHLPAVNFLPRHLAMHLMVSSIVGFPAQSFVAHLTIASTSFLSGARPVGSASVAGLFRT